MEKKGEHLYLIGKASQQLGVSIPMVRNWIYSGKIKTLRTAGGEHRIPESEIRRMVLEHILIFRSFTWEQIVEVLQNRICQLENIKMIIIADITTL